MVCSRSGGSSSGSEGVGLELPEVTAGTGAAAAACRHGSFFGSAMVVGGRCVGRTASGGATYTSTASSSARTIFTACCDCDSEGTPVICWTIGFCEGCEEEPSNAGGGTHSTMSGVAFAVVGSDGMLVEDTRCGGSESTASQSNDEPMSAATGASTALLLVGATGGVVTE